jgi:hypothetical protein
MRTKKEIICIKMIKTTGAITNRRINGDGESIRTIISGIIIHKYNYF